MLYGAHYDIAIDLLMKNGYTVYMNIVGNNIYWEAECNKGKHRNSSLRAMDVLRLLALMIIEDDWNSKDSVYNYYDDWIK